MAALPSYLVASAWGNKQSRTEVFAFGPPGTTFVSPSSIEAVHGGRLEFTSNDFGCPGGTVLGHADARLDHLRHGRLYRHGRHLRETGTPHDADAESGHGHARRPLL